MTHPTTDICDQGHRFAMLPDHPIKDGRPRCPHCMVAGLRKLEACERIQDAMMAAVLDVPEAFAGGDSELLLRRAWERARQARLRG